MRPVGDHAALLEFPDNAAVHAAARAARSRFGDQLVEVVPGHQTLLLVWPDGSVIPDISEPALQRASSEISGEDPHHPETIVVPTIYDGDDLEAVAEALAISSAAVVEVHGGAVFTVAFMGFAPGFPYLVADEPDPGVTALLGLPRLATPRTEVPAGSVAVAAGYCGIYPRSSPGGWNLLGRTDVVLFDAGGERPALLEPGARVRFEAV